MDLYGKCEANQFWCSFSHIKKNRRKLQVLVPEQCGKH